MYFLLWYKQFNRITSQRKKLMGFLKRLITLPLDIIEDVVEDVKEVITGNNDEE